MVFDDYSLTTADVAHALNVSTDRVNQFVKAGRLSPHQTRLGRLYSTRDVGRLAAERREQARGNPLVHIPAE
jgi:hypothetical protein